MNKFLVFGDFTTEGKGKKSIEVGKAFDDAILDDIAKADYSIINLESPIVDESCQPIDKYGPNLCSSPIVVDFFDRIREFDGFERKATIESAVSDSDNVLVLFLVFDCFRNSNVAGVSVF